MQIAAYRANVPAGSILSHKIGKEKRQRETGHPQGEHTETDIAAPRMRLGKISERITQVTGAKVQEKQAVDDDDQRQDRQSLDVHGERRGQDGEDGRPCRHSRKASTAAAQAVHEVNAPRT